MLTYPNAFILLLTTCKFIVPAADIAPHAITPSPPLALVKNKIFPGEYLDRTNNIAGHLGRLS